jgi:hypothetical protein
MEHFIITTLGEISISLLGIIDGLVFHAEPTKITNRLSKASLIFILTESILIGFYFKSNWSYWNLLIILFFVLSYAIGYFRIGKFLIQLSPKKTEK